VSESSPVTAALPDTSAIFERNGAWVTVMLPSRRGLPSLI